MNVGFLEMTIQRLETCISDVSRWMAVNKQDENRQAMLGCFRCTL